MKLTQKIKMFMLNVCWFQQAANSGCVDAMVQLGIKYYFRYKTTMKKDDLLTSLGWLEKALNTHSADNINKNRFLIKITKYLYYVHKELGNFCRAMRYYKQSEYLRKKEQLTETKELRKEEYLLCIDFSYFLMSMKTKNNCQDCNVKKHSLYSQGEIYLRRAITLSQLIDPSNVVVNAEITLLLLLIDEKVEEIKDGETKELALKIINNPKSSRDVARRERTGLEIFKFISKNMDPLIALSWCRQLSQQSDESIHWATLEYARECWKGTSRNDIHLLSPASTDVDEKNHFETGLQLLHSLIKRDNYEPAKKYLEKMLKKILTGSTREKSNDGKIILVLNLEKNFELLFYHFPEDCYFDNVQTILSKVLSSNEIFGKKHLFINLAEKYGFSWQKYFGKNYNLVKNKIEKLSLSENSMKKVYEEIIHCPFFPVEISKIILSYLPWNSLFKKQEQK
jgi:hypothetical protein